MTNAVMIAPSDLKESLNSLPSLADYQLYLIARRPRLTLTGVSGGRGAWTFDLENPAGETLAADLTPADGEDFHVAYEEGGYSVSLSRDGTVFFTGKPSLLPNLKATGALDRVDAEEDPAIAHLDLEVLYIGKSDDNRGVAYQRLNSHSTLQQILADHLDHAPDYEIWVIPMRFGALNTVTVVHGHDSERDLAASIEIAKKGYAPVLGQKSIVALAEAASIRYFQPEYNVHYKKSFPSRQHISYDDVWPFDFGALGVVIDTLGPIGCRIWGPGAAPSFHHEDHFPVDPITVRRPLFTVEHVLGLYGDSKPATKA